MRITIVGPVYPYRGGIAHYTTMLAIKLQQAGHAVRVVSFRRQYPAWLYPGETDRDISHQPIVVPAEYKLDPLYPWTWLQSVQHIAKQKPDLVIIQWWTTFWAPALAVITRLLRSKDIPVVYVIHNVMPHETRFWDRWLALLALTPANSFIAQAEREAARLRTLLPQASLLVSPLPVFDMFSESPITREEARAKLDLPPNEIIVLFFGIVRPYKGLRFLLHAFEILKANGFSGHLVIAGEFWESVSEYHALIEKLGIADRVHIFNRYIPNEDISAFFQAADLFAAPYIDGTQSASAKLALGFCLPMVLTKCIVDETLALQENIWQADEGDACSLANAITRAVENGLGRRTRQSADDWVRTVQVIENLK